ncbi:MAG: DNA polymerase III subunit delta [Desulfovibrionaceae bacterium]|nr:DNA polymerase III subunit delta [Desulfovibrionaceae bacterium]
MPAAKPAKKSATSRPGAAAEQLPGPDEAGAAFTPALSAELERPRAVLTGLRGSPPQLVHLEGGSTRQRVALALWWAALLNCEREGPPCLACPTCLRVGGGMFADMLLLDGRAGSIKIDEVRALRPLLGEPPRFGRARVIVMAEAQALGIEAANSLLKALEDPCPDTCFVFTVPQRERLLPTLVSRGWVITLPWPDPGQPSAGALREWEDALARFLERGGGWFEKTAAKGAVDAAGGQEVVLLAQKALAARLAGRGAGSLAASFARIPTALLPVADELFGRCQEALQAQVNPGLVLDYMATQLYALAQGRILR